MSISVTNKPLNRLHAVYIGVLVFSMFAYSTASANTVPEKPANFEATPLSTTSIKLEWDGSNKSNPKTSYRLLRNGASIATTSELNFIDIGLSANTSYVYDVMANVAGQNSFISSLSVSTLSGSTAATEANGLKLASNKLLSATMYEDAENGGAANWDVYTSTSGTVTNVFDDIRQSRVINFSGDDLRSGYRMNRNAPWDNTSEFIASFALASNNAQVYISINTKLGHRYLQYTGVDEDLLTASTDYIHHGLGRDAMDGSWRVHVRDLEQDLADAEPSNILLSVKRIMFRGTSRVDNIQLSERASTLKGSQQNTAAIAPHPQSTASKAVVTETDVSIPTVSETVASNAPASEAVVAKAVTSGAVVPGSVPSNGTVYEDAENGGTASWDIYTTTPGTITNVFDDIKQSRVIQFLGDDLRSGYRMNRNAPWSNTSEFIASFALASKNATIYISVNTKLGHRYLHYSGVDEDLLTTTTDYIHHGLGIDAMDGSWQVHVRDLEQDLADAEPSNALLSVNRIMFRGTSRVDDIQLYNAEALDLALGQAITDYQLNTELTVVEQPTDERPLLALGAATSDQSANETVTSEPAVSVVVDPIAVKPATVESVAVEPVINLVAPESVPAFPGAEGHGAESIGGRGGIVVKVTNLNDSGPGSLREALTMTVPRIIVFEVSGTIDLQSRIYVRAVNSFFTLAGQTAPGDGIAIRNHLLGFVGVQHGIVRHLRVRHGCPAGCNISIADNIHILAGTNNLILDHISMTWHNDENINIYGDNIHDVTVQRSIMAEGGTLCYEGATHVSGEKHNLGALFTGADHSRITFAKNYMAHSCYRNYQQSSGQYEYINGINYNTSKLDFSFTQVPATAYEPLQADIVGYHFKEGPQTRTHHLYDLLRYGAASTNAETRPSISLYVNDVTATTSDGGPHPFAPNGSLNKAAKYRTLGGTSTMPVLERRTTPSVQAKYPVSVVPSTQVPDRILPSVGASKPKRDPVDERIVNDFYSLGIWEVSNINQYPVLSTYDVQTDTDNDGMPDSWETNNGLDPFSADDQNGDINNDGYTNIENYINSI